MSLWINPFICAPALPKVSGPECLIVKSKISRGRSKEGYQCSHHDQIRSKREIKRSGKEKPGKKGHILCRVVYACVVCQVFLSPSIHEVCMCMCAYVCITAYLIDLSHRPASFASPRGGHPSGSHSASSPQRRAGCAPSPTARAPVSAPLAPSARAARCGTDRCCAGPPHRVP